MSEAASTGEGQRARRPAPLDRFVPAAVRARGDRHELVRYRSFAVTALVIGGTQTALLLVYFAIREAPSALEIITLGVGGLYPYCLVALLRFVRRLERYNVLMASCALLATTSYVAVSGGLLSPGLPIFAIIPASGFALGGRAATLRYILAILGAITLVAALSLLGWLPSSTLATGSHLGLRAAFIIHCVVLVGMSSFSTTVSRSRASRALQTARAEAERASVAKSRFLAVMSHELRTPLTGVLGSIDLLAAVSDKPEQREYLDILRSSATALLSVVNDVLDFSRVDAGKLELRPTDFDLAGLLREVERLFLPVARQQGLDLHIETGDLGPAPRRADASRIRQVLMNLVGNALKFTERGRVVIRGRAVGDARVRVEVEDTGIGLSPAQREGLFQPFSQVDASATRARSGAGLGLAISRALVEAMGGAIGVSSREGVGSCFYFELECPLAESPTSAEAPSRAPAAARPLRILVAEDTQVAALVIRQLLTRLGHEVEVVRDGEEAVAAVTAGRGYDLVLMDMHMPRLDGPGATRAIRALPGELGALPIYALSADALKERRAAYLASGLDGYLVKPVELDALARVLERVSAREPPRPLASASA